MKEEKTEDDGKGRLDACNLFLPASTIIPFPTRCDQGFLPNGGHKRLVPINAEV